MRGCTQSARLIRVIPGGGVCFKLALECFRNALDICFHPEDSRQFLDSRKWHSQTCKDM